MGIQLGRKGEEYRDQEDPPCILKQLVRTSRPAGSVVEHPLRDREVVGSVPGRAIPKALKMVPVATLLGAQHNNASTGFSSPNKISHN